MEELNINNRFRVFAVTILVFFTNSLIWAQEKTAELDLNTATVISSYNWLQNPLVWVIAAIIFITLIAIISKGGKK